MLDQDRKIRFDWSHLGPTFTITSQINREVENRPELHSFLQLLHQNLLSIYHAYAVLTFLEQFFTIPNADRLLNSILCRSICSEEQWLQIIRENCPQFDELVKTNPNMNHFIEQFHSFYDSIPTQMNQFYQAESSKFEMIDAVSIETPDYSRQFSWRPKQMTWTLVMCPLTHCIQRCYNFIM